MITQSPGGLFSSGRLRFVNQRRDDPVDDRLYEPEYYPVPDKAVGYLEYGEGIECVDEIG